MRPASVGVAMQPKPRLVAQDLVEAKPHAEYALSLVQGFAIVRSCRIGSFAPPTTPQLKVPLLSAVATK